MLNIFRYLSKIFLPPTPATQQISNIVFCEFLKNFSLEHFEEIAKNPETVPFLDVDDDESDIFERDQIVEKKIEFIQLFLVKLDETLIQSIETYDPNISECPASFFAYNPDFIAGVSPQLFSLYKKAVTEKLKSVSLPYFNAFLQLLNLNVFEEMLKDYNECDDEFSKIFRLLLNIIHMVFEKDLSKDAVEKVVEVLFKFFEKLKEILKNLADYDKKIFSRVLSKLLPPQFKEILLFKNVENPNIKIQPLIFPKWKFFLFQDDNFYPESNEIHLFNSSEKNPKPDEDVSPSVIIVCKGKNKSFFSFRPQIELNNDTVYVLCGMHVLKRDGILSYYYVTMEEPCGIWIELRNGQPKKLDVQKMAFNLHNFKQNSIFAVYEKTETPQNTNKEQILPSKSDQNFFTTVRKPYGRKYSQQGTKDTPLKKSDANFT